jgi:putative ABC transport system permease protein
MWFAGMRRRPLRNALTVAGIAVGVALSFAVIAQNVSVSHGAADTYRTLALRAKFAVTAIGDQGMPMSTVARILHVHGVAGAAPVIDEVVTLRHGSKLLDVHLVGIGEDDRSTTRGRRPSGLRFSLTIAEALGVRSGQRLLVRSASGQHVVSVERVIPRARLGVLVNVPMVVASLPLAQRLSGHPGRVQRVLVTPRRCDCIDAKALRRAGGTGTDVHTVDSEIRAVEQASALDRSSSSLFAGLSLLVGGLLAYASMALTMAERRREIAILRALGCSTGALLFVVLADALLLGTLGTALGLAGGRLALGWLLAPDQSLLGTAFLLGHRLIVPPLVVILSCAAGLATAATAALLPAREAAKVSPADALRREPESTAAGTIPTRLPLALACTLAVLGIALTVVGYGMAGVLLWVFAGLLLVPVAIVDGAHLMMRLMPAPGGAARVGVAEVAAFPARAVAAAAVVSLAVSGLTIVNGAVANLETGTARLAASSYPPGELFVTVAARKTVFFTRPFDASIRTRLEHLPGVAHVRPWRAAFLDWGDRRVLMFAFANGVPRQFRAGELVKGSSSAAGALVRDPTAAAMSADLAAAQNLRIGDRFTLQTPVGPRRLHVVALITNYGWVPGAISLNAASAAAWWGRDEVTAYEVGLARGADPAATTRLVRDAVRPLGLGIASGDQLRARASDSARSQLANLRRIGQLIGLAGLLAVASATLASVLARLRRLSALQTLGMSRRQISVSLLSEVGFIVGVGAFLGVAVGIGGHALVVHYLADKFAMAVAFHPSAVQLLTAISLTALIVLVATGVAVRSATRAPLATAMQET